MKRGKVPFPPTEFNDVKFIWEPARFGWAFTLGRAYLVSGDERYSQSFWKHTETFLESNPPYLGPQWTVGAGGCDSTHGAGLGGAGFCRIP